MPVVRVPELMEDGDFLADVLSVARDASGAFWPVLKMPYRLSRTPARIRAVPGMPEVRHAIDDEGEEHSGRGAIRLSGLAKLDL